MSDLDLAFNYKNELDVERAKSQTLAIHKEILESNLSAAQERVKRLEEALRAHIDAECDCVESKT